MGLVWLVKEYGVFYAIWRKEFNFVFIGLGDFMQLKPVNEEHIGFKNSWLVKHLLNNNRCELTKVHRFDENKLLPASIAEICGDDESARKMRGINAKSWLVKLLLVVWLPSLLLSLSLLVLVVVVVVLWLLLIVVVVVVVVVAVVA